MTHYKIYGFELRRQDFYHPPEVNPVVVSRVGNLALWAKSQGTSYGEVKYLNPWLRDRALPRGTWTIDLPESSAPMMLATPVKKVFSDTLESDVTYLVKRGDSLAQIARKYGVTVNDLMAWNRLKSGSYLKAGRKLIVIANEANLER